MGYPQADPTILRRPTNSWSALGAGVDSCVNAIAISGSDVYVGGFFWQAGGVEAKYIAKWNGSSWSALGTGMNSSVYAIAISGNDVYAGGTFWQAGGVEVNYIAKWNGSSWSALGTGMNSSVKAIVVSGSDVYAGGYFTRAGGYAANNIAKGTPTTGNGAISGTVYANSVAPANVVAGAFVAVCMMGSACPTTYTNANGQYSVTGLPDGSYTANAFPPAGSKFLPGTIGPLTISGGATLTGQDIVLTPANGAISGTVYANSVAPANVVAGAFVQMCMDSVCQTTSTNTSGQYSVTGLSDGSYTARAFPPAGSNLLPGAIGPLTMSGGATLTGQNIVFLSPTPLPAGTTISPSWSGGGIPVVHWRNPLVLTTHGCTGWFAFASYRILQGGTVIRSGEMPEGPPGTYSASIAPFYPIHGPVQVEITLICPSGTTEIEGAIYILDFGQIFRARLAL